MFENKEMLPFEELLIEQRNQVVAAWLRGNLEVYSNGFNGYIRAPISALSRTGIYRIPEKKLEIPWDIIEDQWLWAAMEKDGCVSLFNMEPRYSKITGYWAVGQAYKRTPLPLKIDTAGIDVETSLVQRPAWPAK